MEIFLDAPDNCAYDESFFENICNVISEFVEFEEDAELSIVLTDDETIREINLKYRNVDKATDVLSFPMMEPMMLGDIMISLDTAVTQALDFKISVDMEVAFLFIHGFLHLLGYDHELGKEAEDEMFALQEEILKGWEDQYGKQR